MAKPKPIGFVVRKSDKPFHGKFFRVLGYVDGQRKQYWFATEKEAKADAADRNQEQNAYGSTLNLTSEARLEASRADELLQGSGKSILDAVRFYLDHAKRQSATVPFSTLAKEIRAEFARKAAADEIGARQASTLSVGLHKLEVQFGDRLVSEITTNEVRKWLTELPLSARTKTNQIKIGRQVFSLAIDYGYTSVNPFKAIKPFIARVSEENSKVAILTADEADRLIHAADAEVVPFLALSLFAGIRIATLERLDWSDIRLEEKRVIVPGWKGKNQKRYEVTLAHNLMEWLRPYVREHGSLLIVNRNGKPDRIATRKAIVKAAKTAGVNLPDNAGRHTFISMHVALHKNIAQTALEANNSPEVILSTYLDVVKIQGDAAKYFAIFP